MTLVDRFSHVADKEPKILPSEGPDFLTGSSIPEDFLNDTTSILQPSSPKRVSKSRTRVDSRIEETRQWPFNSDKASSDNVLGTREDNNRIASSSSISLGKDGAFSL